MALTLCTLDRTWAVQVSELRRLAYTNNPDFVADETLELDWSAVDDASRVLGVIEDDQLLATMRLRLLPTGTRVLSEVEGADGLDDVTSALPALLLDRAATARARDGEGLNTAMRLAVIHAARRVGFKRLYGVVYQSAPRVSLMTRIGYRFIDIGTVSGPFLARTTHLLALLDLTRDGPSVESLRTAVPDGRGQWVGESLEHQLSRWLGEVAPAVS